MLTHSLHADLLILCSITDCVLPGPHRPESQTFLCPCLLICSPSPNRHAIVGIEQRRAPRARPEAKGKEGGVECPGSVSDQGGVIGWPVWAAMKNPRAEPVRRKPPIFKSRNDQNAVVSLVQGQIRQREAGNNTNRHTARGAASVRGGPVSKDAPRLTLGATTSAEEDEDASLDLCAPKITPQPRTSQHALAANAARSAAGAAEIATDLGKHMFLKCPDVGDGVCAARPPSQGSRRTSMRGFSAT